MGSLAFVLLGAIYTAIGRLVARRLRLGLRGVEAFAWAVGLGTGVASCALFALLATGALRTGGRPSAAAFGWLALLLLVLAAWDRIARKRDPPPGAEAGTPWDAWSIPPLVAVVALAFASLGPEVGCDAISYHLPAAARAGRDGLGPMPGLLDGEYRLGVDLLLAPAVSLDGSVPRGTGFLEALAGAALVAGVFAEARRRTSGPLACAVAILFLGIPVLAAGMTTAGVDVGVGLYGFLGLGAAARAVRGEAGRSALAAGAFAGFAAGAKLPGAAMLVAVPVALAVGVGGRAGRRAALAAFGAGALVAAPWFARAAVDMGQPAFPLFATSLGSGWADPAVVKVAVDGILDQTRLPRGILRGFVGTARFVRDEATHEPTVLVILLLAVASIARPSTRAQRGLLAGAGVALVAWAWILPISRFGLSLVGWAAVAAAGGLARFVTTPARARGVVAVSAAAALGVALAHGRPVLDRWRAVVSADAATAFARAEAGEALDQASAARDLPRPVGLGISAPAYVGLGSISLQAMRNGVVAPSDWEEPTRLLASLHRLGIRSLVLHSTGPDDPIVGTVTALRRLGATVEAPSSPPGWWRIVLREGP